MIDPRFFKTDLPFHGSKGLVQLATPGEFLFYRRDHNTNTYPGFIDPLGGGRDPGESGFETGAREIFEETGFIIDKKSVVYAKAYPSIKHPGQCSWFFVVYTDYKVEDVDWGDEGVEPHARSLQSYLDLDPLTEGVPDHQQRIRDYLALL